MTSRKKKRSPQLPGGQMSMTNKRGGLLSPSIVKYTFDNRSGIECLTQSGTRLIPNRHHTGWLNNSLDQIDTSSGVHPQITNLMGTVVSRKEQYGMVSPFEFGVLPRLSCRDKRGFFCNTAVSQVDTVFRTPVYASDSFGNIVPISWYIRCKVRVVLLC